jgi:hypothetical protein
MRVNLVQSRDHNHLNDIELVLAMTAVKTFAMFYLQVLTLVLLAAVSVNSGMSIFNVCYN